MEYPELEVAREEAFEALLDMAENNLMKNVRKGHAGSIFFTLKTRGKSRGYVERTETTGADGVPLIDLSGALQTLKDKFKK